MGFTGLAAYFALSPKLESYQGEGSTGGWTRPAVRTYLCLYASCLFAYAIFAGSASFGLALLGGPFAAGSVLLGAGALLEWSRSPLRLAWASALVSLAVVALTAGTANALVEIKDVAFHGETLVYQIGLCWCGCYAGLRVFDDAQERAQRVAGTVVLGFVVVGVQYWHLLDAVRGSDAYSLPFIPNGHTNPGTYFGVTVVFSVLCAALSRSWDSSRKGFLVRGRALRGEIDRMRSLLDHCSSGVVAFDQRMRVIVWNRNVELMTAVEAKDAVGRNLEDLFPPNDHRLKHARMALEGKASSWEDTRTFEEAPVVYLGNCWPIKDHSGSVIAGIVFVEDVTQRRQLEEAFRQSQKMETVGQLTGGVAHDINNLMHAISCTVETLPQGEETGDAKVIIRRALDRGSALTRQLLSFSGAKTSGRSVVELSDHVSDARGLVEQTIQPSGVAITWNVVPGTWPVEVNAADLDLTLMNLFLNARTAIGPDEGSITVDIRNEAPKAAKDGGEAADFVRVSVKDSGRGMSPEETLRAFEPFYSTKEGGTGLGLTQVQTFARNCGGKVGIHSFPGVGTTVTIRIPRSVSPVDVKGASRPTASGRGEVGRVLVVDDDQMVVDSSAGLLGRLGWDVMTADSGEEAMDLLGGDGGGIDVVLTDVIMPGGMDGNALADRIKAAHPAISVVLTSGFAKVSAGSPHPMLPKPWTVEEFERTVGALRRPAPKASRDTRKRIGKPELRLVSR